MSPAVALVVTVLERTAELIEDGMPPAKALRRAAVDLTEYAEAHGSEVVPGRPFTAQMREPQRRAA